MALPTSRFANVLCQTGGCVHQKGRTKADVLKECTSQKVEQMLFVFTDVLGSLKAQQTPFNGVEESFNEGVLVDGSSVEGYVRIEESDLRAKPDPETFNVLPWEIGGQKVGMVVCDVVNPDGSPFEGDPRHILKQTLARRELQGCTVNMGPESEYFYFRLPNGVETLDHGGYFDLVPDDIGLDLRTKTAAALRQLGIHVEVMHHEVADSQHEIDIRYRPALEMADTVLVYRWVVKRIARQAGYHATFMPKPIAGQNGSGMHVHQSIFKDGENLFFSPEGRNGYHLSEYGKRYLAGLLHHAPGITLVLNQWVNSYKRLVPGYEAPVYICWGNRNRSALVRVPGYHPGREMATRLELRSADPACNPYLAFALMISAGLDGINDESIPLPDPVEADVYHLSPAERAHLGIGSLPGDLNEAITLFSGSSLCRATLGEHTFVSLVNNKIKERDEFRRAVTDFELERYLHL